MRSDMRPDHEAKLNAALDELYLKGSVAILWWDLYLWYNANRLGRRSYADIIVRWKTLCSYYGHGADDTPELEEIKPSDAWLLLHRTLFKEEERTPLANRTD